MGELSQAKRTRCAASQTCPLAVSLHFSKAWTARPANVRISGV
jgi:hypothetical protein